MTQLVTSEKLLFRRRKQIDTLYSQAALALLASVTCGAVLVALTFDIDRSRELLIWGAIMIVVAVVRYGVIRAFHSQQPANDDLSRWRYIFAGTLFASGLAWGAASFLVAPSVALADQAIVIIFLCGFVAAAVAAFSVDRLAFGAFIAPALGIPAVNLTLFGDSIGHTLAGVLVIFGAFLLANALRSNTAHKKDFDSQFEKQQLAATLEVEKNKIVALANDLEVRVGLRTDELRLMNKLLIEQVAEISNAEAKTKIEEARFLEIFDRAPIGMLVIHADSGRVVRANSAVCEFLGYDTAELSGMMAEKLYCPSERASISGESMFKRDSVTERRYIHRRGFVIWGRTSTGVLAAGDPGDAHIVIQIEDLSELKRARDDLSERGDSFEVAFDAAPVGMAVIDGSGRIVNGNTCIRSMLNLDGKIEGRSLTSILNAGDEERSSGILSRIFTGELDSIEFEHQLFGRGDTSRPVVIRITRVKGHSATRPFAVVHLRDKFTELPSLPQPERSGDAKLVALRATA